MGFFLYLWASKDTASSTSLYVFHDTPLSCESCEKTFDHGDPIVHYFNERLKRHEILFCLPCYGSLDEWYSIIGGEWKIALYCTELPASAYRIISPVQLSVSHHSLQDAARAPSVHTINRATRSGREGYSFDDSLTIGKSALSVDLARQEELDAIEHEPLKFLAESKDATPVLEYHSHQLRLQDKNHG